MSRSKATVDFSREQHRRVVSLLFEARNLLNEQEMGSDWDYCVSDKEATQARRHVIRALEHLRGYELVMTERAGGTALPCE